MKVAKASRSEGVPDHDKGQGLLMGRFADMGQRKVCGAEVVKKYKL